MANKLLQSLSARPVGMEKTDGSGGEGWKKPGEVGLLCNGRWMLLNEVLSV